MDQNAIYDRHYCIRYQIVNQLERQTSTKNKQLLIFDLIVT